MELKGKRGQENGPKAEKDQAERATGLGKRTRERCDIEKWDQTDSREIPDMGEKSEPPASLRLSNAEDEEEMKK